MPPCSRPFEVAIDKKRGLGLIKLTMKRALYFVLVALYPGLAYAQVDESNYLNQAQAAEVSGINGINRANTAGEGLFSTDRIQAAQSLQTYKQDMVMIIDSKHQTKSQAITAAEMAKYDHCVTLAAQASKSTVPDERGVLYVNFLNESGAFLKDHPDATHLWVMRGATALALNKPDVGWEAGHNLLAMPAKEREEPHIQKLLTILGSKGWLGKDKPAEEKSDSGAPSPGSSAK